MKRNSCVIKVLSLVFFVQTINGQSLENAVKQKDAAIDKYIETEMKKRKIPGLVLGICDQNRFVMLKAYGLADIQNQAPVRKQSVFDLASITKQFAAGAIMLLAQEGKLKVSDPVKMHVKDCPQAWNDITIQHLLTHTSGLPRSTFSGLKTFSKDEYFRLLDDLQFTKENHFQSIKTDTLDFKPGEKFQYSDEGYLLLGIIIDNITGSYKNYLQQKILTRVGMHSTYFVDQTVIHPFEARGYTLRNGELVNIRRIRNGEIPSPSGMFSNADDLRKWDSVLNTESLFTKESKRLMWESSRLNNADQTGYGFGWYTKKLNNKLIINHTGVTGTEILKFTDDKITFIVLTNLGTQRYDNVNSVGLAGDIAEMLGYKNLIDSNYVTRNGHKIATAKKGVPEKLTGTYRMSNGQQRKILLENGILYLERGGTQTQRWILAPLDDGTFLMLGVANETIIEIRSDDYKILGFKGSGITFVRE